MSPGALSGVITHQEGTTMHSVDDVVLEEESEGSEE